MAAPPSPRHTYVHLPKDIVAGLLNHNCNNSTIPFYPVIFFLSLLHLSFYNCKYRMEKVTPAECVSKGDKTAGLRKWLNYKPAQNDNYQHNISHHVLNRHTKTVTKSNI